LIFFISILTSVGVNVANAETTITYTGDSSVEVTDGVSTYEKFIDIDCEQYGSTALTDTGNIYTWGSAISGQLGDGTSENRNDPTPGLIKVEGVTFSKIDNGFCHTLALSSEGQIYSWGCNDNGQLGDGTTYNEYKPQLISVSGVSFTEIACGSRHSLAISTEGKLYAWGKNTYGQLGIGTTSSYEETPQLVSTGITFAKIAAGVKTSIAISKAGKLYYWGCKLGISYPVEHNETTPVLLSDTMTFKEIACGDFHALAIDSNDKLYTLGFNNNGQLGDGTSQDRETLTAIVSSLSFSAIDGGQYLSLATTTNGDLYAWGTYQFDLLGDGGESTSNVLSPKKIIVSGVDFNGCASCFYHAMALTETGELYSWGDNNHGQLGDGTSNDSNSPQKVSVVPQLFVKYDFATNGGSLNSVESRISNDTYVDLTKSDSNAKFLGWNIDNNASLALDSVYVGGKVSSLTLYAIYRDNIITFPDIPHLTFTLIAGSTNPVIDGGSISFTVNIEDHYAGDVSLKIGENNLNAIEEVYTINNVTEDIYVLDNASSINPIKYNIYYNLNGGTNNENNLSTYTVEDSNILLSDPSMSGYTFESWEEGNSITTANGVNVTRTATWSIKAPTITTTNAYSKEYDGDYHNLSIMATHSLGDSYGLNYQWYKSSGNEVNKVGSNNSNNFAVKNVSENGNYFCVVSISDTNSRSNSITSLVIVANIIPKNINVTVVDVAEGAFTYDGQAKTTTATHTELVGSDSLSYELGYDDNINAGTCNVSITSTSITNGIVSNYNVITLDTDAKFTINRATLTVSPKAQTISYGQDIQQSEYTITGYKNGEGIAVVSGVPILTASSLVVAGDKTISLVKNSLSADNYEFVVGNSAQLVVNRATLTVSPKEQTIVYGEVIKQSEYTITGYQNGEGIAVVSGVPILTASSLVVAGEKTISLGINNLVAENYEFVAGNSAQLVVNRATLTVSPKEQTIVYGEDIQQSEYTITGYQNGEGIAVVSGVPILTASSQVVAGEKTISLGINNLSAHNYEFVVGNSAQLIINRAKLTVSPKAQTIVYGEVIKQSEYTITGYQNGEGVAVVSGVPILAASSLVVAGEKTISLGIDNLDAENYEFVAGNSAQLVVNRATLTVSPKEQTIVYGEDIQQSEYTITGYQNEEDIAVVSGVPILTASSLEVAGEKTISLGINNLVAENYEFIVGDSAKLVINNAMLTITAADKTITYGDDIPTFTYNYDGIKYEEILECSATTDYSRYGNVGDYTITVAPKSYTNYNVTFIVGTLKVVEKDITIKADDKTITYGDVIPTFTISCDKIVNGDILNNSATTDYIRYGDIGDFTITVTPKDYTNYDISYETGTLSVSKKNITINIENLSKVYGNEDPVIVYKQDGLINGDVLTGNLFRMPGENVGIYKINSNLANINYIINFVTANLTITPKPISIIANKYTKYFGEEDPAFTYTIVKGNLKAGDELVGKLEREVGEQSNSYIIYQGTLINENNTNYDISYEPNILSILPVKSFEILSVLADSKVGDEFIDNNNNQININVKTSNSRVSMQLGTTEGSKYYLYKDKECTEIISDNELSVNVGKNNYYIKLVSEDNTEKVYECNIIRENKVPEYLYYILEIIGLLLIISGLIIFKKRRNKDKVFIDPKSEIFERLNSERIEITLMRDKKYYYEVQVDCIKVGLSRKYASRQACVNGIVSFKGILTKNVIDNIGGNYQRTFGESYVEIYKEAEEYYFKSVTSNGGVNFESIGYETLEKCKEALNKLKEMIKNLKINL